jgi:ribonucleotide reductase alpha subunit
MASEMFVIKRDGESEIVSFDKILRRIKRIGQEAGIKINYTQLAMKVIDQLYDKISTTKIDELTAEQCASMSSIHYDYGTLASHITVSNHHKNTESNILTVMRELHNYKDKHGNHSPLITRELLETIDEHYTAISERIDFKRDYVFDYFGFKTLEKTYLMRINGKVVERPQHMWMRVSLGIHGKDVESALRTYDLMSQKFFTHATPTLFNAGTPRPQLSSCFLLSMENDSIDGIYNTLKDCALISKWAGGIGLHIHNVRATNSHIRGTNGTSNGIVPMLRVFNNTAKYVDQCLDPETIVYSKRGPVKIKNIVVGDEVITDDGNFYPIRKVLDYPNYKGDLHTIDVKYSLGPLRVTDMHPLWVIKNSTYIETKFKRLISALDRKLVVPEFVEARDVRKNDFVGFPIPKWEQDIVHFTEDDCRMYGILVGSDAELSQTCRIAFTSVETLKFVETYLQNINIIPITFDRTTYTNIVFTSNNMFKFTSEMIRDVKGEKMVLPNMLHLPQNKTLKLIQGLLETSANFAENSIKLANTSFNVVESTRYLLLRLGILTSGYTKNRCNRAHKKRMIIMSIPKKPVICDLFPNVVACSKSFKFFEHNGYLFSIVKDTDRVESHEGRVIDIEIDNENHHNFLTHNGLVHNGGGKRNGSFAIYMEPWHADIEKFLEMRKNHGDEELKARDLFYALWIPDLFMNRVKSNEPWTLMCPDECPGLSDVYGEEFETLYTKYEAEGKGRATVSARDLWFKVLDAQMETGTPYLCYKDTANNKSNQKNIGVIKSSNLCVAPETTVLTDRGHIRIDTLENQKVNVWNGEEFSEVEIKRTGENQSLIEVHTDDGSVLTCTPYHKFYIQTSCSDVSKVDAQDLKEGDAIIEYKYPDETSKTITISKTVNNNRVDNTFCFTEPKRHMGVFNGILTGQCSEIMEVSTPKETAVCNLASIGLPTFVDKDSQTFNYEKLREVASVITDNLNKVIDVNYYPTDKTRLSNLRHRPIGIGIQGLADVFMLLDIPFHSDEAKEVNKRIFETIYYGALEKSAELATQHGPYETYEGSPASKGILQFDMWNVTPSDHLDWAALKAKIVVSGLRNSLLLAPMPTASTSQILGFNECFEPFTSNIYSRRTMAGEFVLTNKYLMRELIDLGIWNTEVKNNIIANQGSVQHIANVPEYLKQKYKTVWEIPMRHVIDMAADRGAFICQSQSLNLWQEDPNYNSLTSMHFYAWSKGLKTGIYYLRRRAKHRAQQFTIEPKKNEECEMCSS